MTDRGRISVEGRKSVCTKGQEAESRDYSDTS